MISRLVTEFASTGADRVVRDEKRVDQAISNTAKNAQKSEAKTQRWMERHKTALTAVGVAAAGAMAGIVTASPDLCAALDEVYLNFSMLAMSIGEDWAPAFEWLAGVTEGLADAYEGLPEPIQDVIAWGILLAGGLLIVSGIVSGLTWLLGPLATWLGISGVAAEGAGGLALAGAGGLTTLGIAVGALAGALLGGLGVWILWKVGAMDAIDEAGARLSLGLRNSMTVLSQFGGNLITWLGLVSQNALVAGSQFGLNWVKGVVENIPLVGLLATPILDRLSNQLSGRRADLQSQYESFEKEGGLFTNVGVGLQKPAWLDNEDYWDNPVYGAFGGTVDRSKRSNPMLGWFDSVFGGGSSSLSSEQDRLDDLLASRGPGTFLGSQEGHFGVPVSPSPPRSGSLGGTTYNTPVNVTLNVTGSQAKDFDERKLAQYVRDEVGNALRGRGR